MYVHVYIYENIHWYVYVHIYIYKPLCNSYEIHVFRLCPFGYNSWTFYSAHSQVTWSAKMLAQYVVGQPKKNNVPVHGLEFPVLSHPQWCLISLVQILDSTRPVASSIQWSYLKKKNMCLPHRHLLDPHLLVIHCYIYDHWDTHVPIKSPCRPWKMATDPSVWIEFLLPSHCPVSKILIFGWCLLSSPHILSWHVWHDFVLK